MTESKPSNDPGVQKRRSTRIAQSVPITVIGVDALGQAFKERTSTVSINCHGCKYQSKHYVPKTSQVTIEIPRADSDAPPRIVDARVAWVQRPRTVRELFQIGVEFNIPGNAWGIAFPPTDWFPLPSEEITLEIPSPIAAAEAKAEPEGRSASEHRAVEHQPSAQESAGHRGAHKEHRAEPPVAQTETPEETPSAPAVESKVRVLPTPTPAQQAQVQAQESMSMARQMARLLAEAKQHLRQSMQGGAAEAVALEVRTAREQVESQIRTTVNEAVQESVTKAAEASVQGAVQKAVHGSLQELVEQATQQVVQNALAAFEQARQASTPKPEELDARVRAAVERVVETSAARLAEQTVQQSVRQTVEQAVKQSVQLAVEKASGSLAPAQASATVIPPTEEMLRQLDEAAQARLANWRKELEDAAGKLQAQTLDRVSAESSAVARKWREHFDAALAGASENMSAQLSQISQAASVRAEEEISARSASLQNVLNEAATEAQKNLEGLCAGLELERTRAEEAASNAGEAARHAEEVSAQVEAMSRASYDAARHQMDSLLASQTEKLSQRVEEEIQKKAGELEKPINDVADNAMRRLAEQIEQQLGPQLERAQQTAEQLANAGQRAEDALGQFRTQMHEVSEQALTASLERMRHQTAELPAEFEKSCRAALAKMEEEIEVKSTETTHTTFEALYKASEWYQKKAQTSMQSALEKMLDQSTGGMRDRAAELSRMFASELDHYSRSYVEHAQGLIEEGAKDVRERTREQIEETAKTATASATDELLRITSDSLARFEEAARASSDRTRTEMQEGASQTLSEFDSRLEERMVHGAKIARQQLEEQLKPLVDAFYAKREAEQRAWLEQMKGAVEQSIEQYKERLENTSNSWLLASATTLGQHSKGVIETLSKAAEERLRDTCSDVFAGLGETLRARLLGVSSEIGTKEKPPEKK
ncbi:MAG: hypothetical protein WBE43_01840 [Candidatus Acidiferrales bacterium]